MQLTWKEEEDDSLLPLCFLPRGIPVSFDDGEILRVRRRAAGSWQPKQDGAAGGERRARERKADPRHAAAQSNF